MALTALQPSPTQPAGSEDSDGRTRTTVGNAGAPDPAGPLVRDPICGMTFRPDEAAATRIDDDGVAYHFCAERCARMFDRQQGARTAAAAAAPGSGGGHVTQRNAAWRAAIAGHAPDQEVTSDAGNAAPTGVGARKWLMPALCLLPLAAVVAVTVFGVSTSTLLTGAIFLLCPLMHLFMMGGHGGHGGHGAQPGSAAGAAQGKNGRSCH
jgi:YHS domain-containing protein